MDSPHSRTTSRYVASRLATLPATWTRSTRASSRRNRRCAAVRRVRASWFRPVPQTLVAAGHPEVVKGEGAAMRISRSAVLLERALVVGERVLEVTVDRRQDAEVLLDPRAQLAAVAAQRQRAEESGTRLGVLPTLERHDPERVHRLTGEDVVLHRRGHLEAPVAQGTAGLRLVAAVADHGQAAERFGEDCWLVRSLGLRDRRLVTLNRFRHAPRVLPLARLPQQLARAPHRAQPGCARGDHALTTPPRSPRSGRPAP